MIIGGHDRMVRQYRTICKEHNCKAKIFTQMPSCLNKKIGNPRVIVQKIFEPNLLKNKLEIKKIKIIQNKSKIAVE